MRRYDVRLALATATGSLAWMLVGCDIGEPPRTYDGLVAVGVGDANGDGHLDLVTISDPGAREGLVVRFGDGTGHFPTSRHIAPRSGHCTPEQDCDCSHPDRIEVYMNRWEGRPT